MKTFFITLVLVCISTIALSQEYRATFGKYPDCLRRGGICTITSTPSSSAIKSITGNISFITQKDGAIILRVYRDKLTKEEQDIILGVPITSRTNNSLQFTMETAIALPKDDSALSATKSTKELSTLEAKTYPTIISDKYIDITIQPSSSLKN